jgi:hypothetical protein
VAEAWVSPGMIGAEVLERPAAYIFRQTYLSDPKLHFPQAFSLHCVCHLFYLAASTKIPVFILFVFSFTSLLKTVEYLLLFLSNVP